MKKIRTSETSFEQKSRCQLKISGVSLRNKGNWCLRSCNGESRNYICSVITGSQARSHGNPLCPSGEKHSMSLCLALSLSHTHTHAHTHTHTHSSLALMDVFMGSGSVGGVFAGGAQVGCTDYILVKHHHSSLTPFLGTSHIKVKLLGKV